jgi:hypothetical protein
MDEPPTAAIQTKPSSPKVEENGDGKNRVLVVVRHTPADAQLAQAAAKQNAFHAATLDAGTCRAKDSIAPLEAAATAAFKEYQRATEELTVAHKRAGVHVPESRPAIPPQNKPQARGTHPPRGAAASGGRGAAASGGRGASRGGAAASGGRNKGLCPNGSDCRFLKHGGCKHPHAQSEIEAAKKSYIEMLLHAKRVCQSGTKKACVAFMADYNPVLDGMRGPSLLNEKEFAAYMDSVQQFGCTQVHYDSNLCGSNRDTGERLLLPFGLTGKEVFEVLGLGPEPRNYHAIARTWQEMHDMMHHGLEKQAKSDAEIESARAEAEAARAAAEAARAEAKSARAEAEAARAAAKSAYTKAGAAIEAQHLVEDVNVLARVELQKAQATLAHQQAIIEDLSNRPPVVVQVPVDVYGHPLPPMHPAPGMYPQPPHHPIYPAPGF